MANILPVRDKRVLSLFKSSHIKNYILPLFLSLILISQTSFAKADEGFQQWLADFYKVAMAEGISHETFQRAFAGVTAPDSSVLKKANYQPEFTLTIWDYLDPRVNASAVKRGLAMKKKYGNTLNAIESRFGVDQHIILAIWSMESNYGAILKKTKRLHSVPHALATLAYADKKRKKFGHSQLIACLKILEAGDIPHRQMYGSWAGAMGHTQFIPTSYLAYGVDWDGDGRRDIWNSVPDALATAANLLHKNGWNTGKTWGYEVYSPANKMTHKEQTKLLKNWSALGYKRPGGKNYPRINDKAVLKLLAEQRGPGFLMIKNFFVLKKYNNSDFYALAVGLLADRLAGYSGMVQEWPKPQGHLSIDQKHEIQRLLKNKGFYQGEVDGFLGNVSRQAIKSYQTHLGIKADGKPSLEVLQKLRQ